MIPRSKTGDCSNQDCNAKNTSCVKVGKELFCLKCRKIQKTKKIIAKESVRPVVDKKKLTKDLDIAYSQYVRRKASDNKGECICFTCGKKESWKKMDCGHFVPRANMYLRWDLRNLRPQCINCNRLNYGELGIYEKNLEKETNGSVSDLLADSKRFCRVSERDIAEMLLDIKNKLKILC